MSSPGKGDNRRPSQVSKEQFERNWDAIFGPRTVSERMASGECAYCGKMRCEHKTKALEHLRSLLKEGEVDQ